MKHAQPFEHIPCLETLKCHLTTLSGGKLGADANGDVSLEHAVSYDWTLTSTEPGIFAFALQNKGQYLSSDSENHAILQTSSDTNTVSDEGRCLWHVKKYDAVEKHFVLENEYGVLGYDRKGNLGVVPSTSQDSSIFLVFFFEFLTGELCHIVCSEYENKLLQCHGVWMNFPRLGNHRGGWETWRFVEAGDNSVYISSWTHNMALGTNADGEAILQPLEKKSEWESWNVLKTSEEGVILRSMKTNRYLGTNGHRVITQASLSDSDQGFLWKLEAPNQASYFVRSPRGLYISCGGRQDKTAMLDERLGQNKVMRLIQKPSTADGENPETGLFAFVAVATGQYLASCGDDAKLAFQDEAFWWILEESESVADGSVCVKHPELGALLCERDGKLEISVDSKSDKEFSWRLEPRLPDSLTRDQCVGQMVGYAGALAMGVGVEVTAMIAAGWLTKQITGTNLVAQPLHRLLTGSKSRTSAPLRDMSIFGATDRPFIDWKGWQLVLSKPQ